MSTCLETAVSKAGVRFKRAPETPLLSTVSRLLAHRWFVLKQGKIFWFKSDLVRPVRRAAVGSFGGRTVAVAGRGLCERAGARDF